MFFKKFKEDSVQIPCQKSQIPRFRPDGPVMRPYGPSVSIVQAYFCSNVSATHPDTLQSSRRIQISSASVRTMWQYRPDTSQCSTSKRISFADINVGRQLQPSGRQVYTVQMLSLIRQDVEKNCNRPEVRVTPSERWSLLWKLCATKVQPSGS
jgi:hypothetical protein